MSFKEFKSKLHHQFIMDDQPLETTENSSAPISFYASPEALCYTSSWFYSSYMDTWVR